MMHNKQKYNITYSEKEKMILFLPGKTGSMHASFMFNHFDFTTALFESDDEQLVFDNGSVMHHHHLQTIKKFEDYSIICTARNPYSRIISYYNHSQRGILMEGKPSESFKEYFVKRVSGGGMFKDNGFFFDKEPQYFLRLENLYHDYIQIPFISNSKLNKSGLLYELCNKKIHSNRESNKSTETYYTEDMADYVYTSLKPYFELLGYKKDSWKSINKNE